MKATKMGFLLSSGREFYANFSELSIGPEPDEFDNRLRIAYGHDGGVGEDYADSLIDPSKQFTNEERKEIAEFMCDLWQTWGAQSPEVEASEK